MFQIKNQVNNPIIIIDPSTTYFDVIFCIVFAPFPAKYVST